MFTSVQCHVRKLKLLASIIRRNIIQSVYPDFAVPRQTIAEYMLRYCSKYLDRTAFIEDARGIQYKYSDVKSIIHSISSSLTKRGLTAGTVVAMIAANSPEYFMLTVTLSSMGCTVTTCNPNYTHQEMAHQLGDSKPSVIFTDQGSLDKVKMASSVKDIYIIGQTVHGCRSVDELMSDSGNCSLIGQADIDLDEQIAFMPYSSGTTGLPKGVMLTHTNIVANCEQINTAFAIEPFQIMLNEFPMFHIYGGMVIPAMSFMSGSTLVVQPKFEPLQFLSAIQKYKISLLHTVPPIVIFLLNNPEVAKYDLSSIRLMFTGAAPLDENLENRISKGYKKYHADFDIFQAYGLTETSPIATVVPTENRDLTKHGSIGLLVPNMACKVVDVLSREELGPNETGEILLKGPNVMKGYFGKSAETSIAFENGWLKTGDLGHYDDDHYFYITDRIKELIKVQATQVAPAELEAVLLQHPSIQDCAVVGVPDSKYGEVPRAFVVKSGHVEEKSIHEHMAVRLSPYKQLRGGIQFVAEIPKNPSGKIMRRLLKDKQ